MKADYGAVSSCCCFYPSHGIGAPGCMYAKGERTAPRASEDMDRDALPDLRNHLARSRDEWLSGSEGLSCTEGSASGKYLRNRLERAFIAGYNYGTAPADRGSVTPASEGK